MGVLTSLATISMALRDLKLQYVTQVQSNGQISLFGNQKVLTQQQ